MTYHLYVKTTETDGKLSNFVLHLLQQLSTVQKLSKIKYGVKGGRGDTDIFTNSKSFTFAASSTLNCFTSLSLHKLEMMSFPSVNCISLFTLLFGEIWSSCLHLKSYGFGKGYCFLSLLFARPTSFPNIVNSKIGGSFFMSTNYRSGRRKIKISKLQMFLLDLKTIGLKVKTAKAQVDRTLHSYFL